VGHSGIVSRVRQGDVVTAPLIGERGGRPVRHDAKRRDRVAADDGIDRLHRDQGTRAGRALPDQGVRASVPVRERARERGIGLEHVVARRQATGRVDCAGDEMKERSSRPADVDVRCVDGRPGIDRHVQQVLEALVHPDRPSQVGLCIVVLGRIHAPRAGRPPREVDQAGVEVGRLIPGHGARSPGRSGEVHAGEFEPGRERPRWVLLVVGTPTVVTEIGFDLAVVGERDHLCGGSIGKERQDTCGKRDSRDHCEPSDRVRARVARGAWIDCS
jgi:hypothetical protein